MATFTNNNIPSPVSLRRLRTFDIVPQHLLSVRGLNMQFIDLVLTTADEMKNLVHSKGGDDRLKHFVLATAFYEPSTRTSCSFQAAMLRLGGSVITLNEEQSSVKKGESLEDTIQTLSCYCDAVVLRHPVKGSAAQAAHVSTKPVINAGDGTGEHPTQALLDLYTIKSELGGALGGVNADSPMVITLLGDLKNG
jgi:aspartate carbamoyltransferase catalytic subunit